MSAWEEILACTEKEHEHYFASLADPETAQWEQLLAILKTSENSEWGRRYNFANIRTISDYQSAVPITNYDEIATAIQRITNGEQSVLFAGNTLFMEKTGGSTGGEKLIPWNQHTLHALQRGLNPWLHNLLTSRPGILRGKSYWSISPALRHATHHNESSIPVGIENDALFFGETMAQLLQQVLVTPASTATTSFSRWRYATLKCLLTEENLSFISIWSPTFLSELLQWFAINGQPLIDDIAADGHSARAKQLTEARAHSPLDATRIWPKLDTVSCWTQGSARQFVAELAQYLPGVHIQGKGLLATENIVTLPIEGAMAPALAINSGFYEFMDDSGNTLTCSELDIGKIYEVLITTWGGLYRYRPGDRVQVAGWMKNTPLLDFVGRAGLVSDLCGEKLDESFVCSALEKAGINRSGFSMLLPVMTPRGYELILDKAQWNHQAAGDFAQRVEQQLQKNPQYHYAVTIGQLQPLCAVRVTSPWMQYRKFMLNKGARLGDIKPPVLSTHPELHQYFLSENTETAS